MPPWALVVGGLVIAFVGILVWSFSIAKRFGGNYAVKFRLWRTVGVIAILIVLSGIATSVVGLVQLFAGI